MTRDRLPAWTRESRWKKAKEVSQLGVYASEWLARAATLLAGRKSIRRDECVA